MLVFTFTLFCDIIFIISLLGGFTNEKIFIQKNKSSKKKLNIIFIALAIIVALSVVFLIARFVPDFISKDNLFILIVVYLFSIVFYISRVYDLRKKSYKAYTSLLYINLALIIFIGAMPIILMGFSGSSVNLGIVVPMLIGLLYMEKKISSTNKISSQNHILYIDKNFDKYLKLSYYPYAPFLISVQIILKLKPQILDNIPLIIAIFLVEIIYTVIVTKVLLDKYKKVDL